MLFIGVEMLIKGIAIWQSMCDRANIWRAPEAIIIGTCVLWIGGRCVLNGGFGCLVPSKRQRAIEACSAALDGSLTRDAYEASNSFLGHAQDVLHFPVGSLQGITGPLLRPGFGSDLVELTALARDKYTAVIEMLRTRPYARFMAGVNDAALEWSGSGAAPRRVITGASDCCTNHNGCADHHICTDHHASADHHICTNHDCSTINNGCADHHICTDHDSTTKRWH